MLKFSGLLLVVAAGGLLSAVPAPDCRLQITQAYHALAEATEPGQARALHLRFNSETFFLAPGKNTESSTKATGDLFVKGRQLYYETPDVRMWQDGRFVSSVFKRQRIVLLTRVKPEAGNVQPLLLMRDSLINSASVLSCRDVVVAGKAHRQVQLGLSPRVKARLGLRRLDFRLTDKPMRVEQVTATYMPGRIARRIILTFATQEWLSSAPHLVKDAKSPVLDAQDKLLPAFAGYQLIDQTQAPAASRHR